MMRAVSYIVAAASLVVEWGVYILAIAAPITALVMSLCSADTPG